VHRPQIAQVAAETGVFRPEEVDVALEVFDDYCDSPGADYWAMGAFSAADELAGFTFYGPTPCTADTWDLYWIAVRPRFQRSGVGRGLIERAERHMASAGARMCVIETSSRDDYSTTRRFYLACGYREAARIADFYDKGDDRVTYVKQFK
jgi:ribosomal protein S18 acetylase RimI-like enzyme